MARAKTKTPEKSGAIKIDRRGASPGDYRQQPHIPDENTRLAVYEMSRAGIPQTRIASALKLSEDTLQRHYRHELDNATGEAVKAVANTLFAKAINGDTTAMIFYLKTRGRWSETQKLNVSGPDDGPIQTESVLDFSELDREGKLALRIALQTAIAKKEGKS